MMAFPEEPIIDDTKRAAAEALMDSIDGDLSTALDAVIDHADLDNRDKAIIGQDILKVQQHQITLRSHVLTVFQAEPEDP